MEGVRQAEGFRDELRQNYEGRFEDFVGKHYEPAKFNGSFRWPFCKPPEAWCSPASFSLSSSSAFTAPDTSLETCCFRISVEKMKFSEILLKNLRCPNYGRKGQMVL